MAVHSFNDADLVVHTDPDPDDQNHTYQVSFTALEGTATTDQGNQVRIFKANNGDLRFAITTQ